MENGIIVKNGYAFWIHVSFVKRENQISTSAFRDFIVLLVSKHFCLIVMKELFLEFAC